MQQLVIKDPPSQSIDVFQEQTKSHCVFWFYLASICCLVLSFHVVNHNTTLLFHIFILLFPSRLMFTNCNSDTKKISIIIAYKIAFKIFYFPPMIHLLTYYKNLETFFVQINFSIILH